MLVYCPFQMQWPRRKCENTAHRSLHTVFDAHNSPSRNPRFFWLWPPKKRTAQTDSHLTVWFGGGPGCSGLSAFFQQNGPISVPDNKENRTIIQPNKYSFTDFGWTMWLDHPVPTGLSQGELDHANEEDVAQQFLTFMKNLYSIFPELHSKKLWFAGESYAGQYIPHLSDHLHNQTDNLNLSGFMIADGRLSG